MKIGGVVDLGASRLFVSPRFFGTRVAGQEHCLVKGEVRSEDQPLGSTPSDSFLPPSGAKPMPPLRNHSIYVAGYQHQQEINATERLLSHRQ
jgi:hypothetical protein